MQMLPLTNELLHTSPSVLDLVGCTLSLGLPRRYSDK